MQRSHSGQRVSTVEWFVNTNGSKTKTSSLSPLNRHTTVSDVALNTTKTTKSNSPHEIVKKVQILGGRREHSTWRVEIPGLCPLTLYETLPL